MYFRLQNLKNKEYPGRSFHWAYSHHEPLKEENFLAVFEMYQVLLSTVFGLLCNRTLELTLPTCDFVPNVQSLSISLPHTLLTLWQAPFSFLFL
jgi:hypothetical protein